MKFPKEFLLGLLDLRRGEACPLTEFADCQLELGAWEPSPPTEVVLVHTEETGKSGRWSIGHLMVFKMGDHHFMAFYTTGATESQDESPFEYEPDMVECQEVQAIQVTTTTWVPINPPKPKRGKVPTPPVANG